MSIVGFPFSMRWPQAVMHQFRSSQLMISDSCSVHVSIRARRSRARTISYRWAVSGTPETHHGDIKAVSFKEKTHGNSSKSGSKTLSVSKAESVLCYFCGKNNILPPIVIRELQSSLTIKTVLMSVRRPMVG